MLECDENEQAVPALDLALWTADELRAEQERHAKAIWAVAEDLKQVRKRIRALKLALLAAVVGIVVLIVWR